MKLFSYLIVLLLPISMYAETNKRAMEAVKLVSSLVSKLQCNSSFTYTDEKLYFGGTSIPSYTILNQLGYRGRAGEWLKSKPKFSFIGELLRQKRQLIVHPGMAMQVYASDVSTYEKRGKKETTFVTSEDNTFVYVTLTWSKGSGQSFLKYDEYDFPVITFTVMIRPTMKVIILDETIVNGKSLVYLLGFRRQSINVKSAGKMRKKYVPFLPKTVLDPLVSQMKELK